METRRVDEVDHLGCPACESLVMPILSSLPLWRAMEDARLEEPDAPDDAPVPETCGRCGKAVEAFGYQFTDVTVYRCSPCRLLFVPGASQRDVRNVWRRANDREERKLAREAAVAQENLASHSIRHRPNPQMRLRDRLAIARTNAKLDVLESGVEAARAAASLLDED